MVRAVRETGPRANMDPPNASQFMSFTIPDTDELEFQARYSAWYNGDCVHSHRSLFSASPSSEHPCWARSIPEPMIFDNQATVANTLRQPQHTVIEGSYTTVYNLPSTPARLDSWPSVPSDPGDRYQQHAPSPINDTHIRATSSQSMRHNLPRLVIDGPQVSGYACTVPTNTYHTGETGINCQYRSDPADLLQPCPYQGRSPSPSGSDECQSPSSDGSWVDVAKQDGMDIDWTESVPNEHGNLSLRQISGEVPNFGGMDGHLGRERGFPISGIWNDYIGNVETSDVSSARLSHSPEPARWSLQRGRDTEIGAPGSEGPMRREAATQRNRDAVSPFNGIACLRCQIKRITVSVSSVRYSRLR